jgi:hypothetical protein
MSLDQVFTLAHDSEFRTLVSFSGPPRAGRVLALEPSGQVRIEMDDPDGGDVLAWPLNGATYAVDDIVYCLLAANAPDSAIVIGAKGSSPAFAPLRASEVRAVDASGLRLVDEAGSLGVAVAVGGQVGIGTADPDGFEVDAAVSETAQGRDNVRLGVSGGTPRVLLENAGYTQWQVDNHSGNFRFFTPGLVHLYLSEAGQVGLGTQSPRGKLHSADGLASLLFWSNGAVGNTPLAIVPDGTGDVSGRLLFFYVVDNGGASVAASATLAPGGTHDVVVSSGTWRFAVSAAGAFTVIRISGTGIAKVAVLALWL